jgi:hypothetical protein
MTLTEFNSSLIHEDPPTGLNPFLLALWYDAKGNWHKSHEIVQDIETKEAALIHAYLHRKEGDLWNADYWYKQAGRHRPDVTLPEEWSTLLIIFLE